MDYRNQLDIIMKAVGVRTKDDVVQSSKKKSPTLSPDSEEYDIVDDISSSDDDLLNAPERSTGPVILEDYTSPEGMRSQTGSVASGSTMEDPYRGNVPESASFDSGVDIHRVKSESKEKLSSSEAVASSQPLPTSPYKPILSPAGDGNQESSSHSTSFHNIPGEDELQSSESDTAVGSRIGDAVAAAVADSENLENEDAEWSILNSASLDEEPSESAQDLVSNLQRKKLFDSMYRLVIDDDLEDILGEEDDFQGPLESSDEEVGKESNRNVKES